MLDPISKPGLLDGYSLLPLSLQCIYVSVSRAELPISAQVPFPVFRTIFLPLQLSLLFLLPNFFGSPGVCAL